ncbi:MAG: hypothetical protein ACYTF1_19680 [Planctomycetota bacterium]
MRAKWSISIGLIICIFAVGTCKDKDNSVTISGSNQTKIICTRCGKEGTLNLAMAANQETWPKECPSCKRWGAYPSDTCRHCSRAVALMDLRTQGFSTPDKCPHCGKIWQAR